MDNLKGTQTEKNLLAALQGESQARAKYTFYAEEARLSGHVDAAQLFERMARNETAHARLYFKYLHDGTLGKTIENLKDAAQGEHNESTVMYPAFAQIARNEGFEDVARVFESVAQIESDHEDLFLHELYKIKPLEGKAPAGTAKMVFRCANCGAVYDEDPGICPVCESEHLFDRVTIMV